MSVLASFSSEQTLSPDVVDSSIEWVQSNSYMCTRQATSAFFALAVGEQVVQLLRESLVTVPPPIPPEQVDASSSSSSSSSSSLYIVCKHTILHHILLFVEVFFFQVVWPRLPALEDLCASYAERNDGNVTLPGGVVLKVTHPITRYGLSTRPPFR
jgi:hypothetical protein